MRHLNRKKTTVKHQTPLVQFTMVQIDINGLQTVSGLVKFGIIQGFVRADFTVF